MKKPNAMLNRIERKYQAIYAAEFKAKIEILQQMCVDSAFMAASDVFQMGPGRCQAFGQAMCSYLDDMASLMLSDAKDDPDMAYTCEKVDQRLKKICGDKFQPWDIRYKDGNFLKQRSHKFKVNREKWEGCQRCDSMLKNDIDYPSYCYVCGKPLTDDAWNEFEKKLGECID